MDGKALLPGVTQQHIPPQHFTQPEQKGELVVRGLGDQINTK